MRPGMECVLDMLRGTCRRRTLGEWDAALDLAQQEHVLPFVAARLLDSSELPETLRPRLLNTRREAALTAFFWTSELTSLLRAFAAAGLEVIPLKGPLLAESIYGDAGLRLSRDLDLLVRKFDYAAAESLLAHLGFAPAGRPDDYHRQWRRASATVELHFDIENPLAIDFDIAGAWTHSVATAFHGQPCRRLAPADELLFLAIHGVRHRFEHLGLILDIALALQVLGDRENPRRRVAPLQHLLDLGHELASRLDPGLGPPANRNMQRLADTRWQELMTAPQPALDWQSQHAFFLETEPTPARRLLRRAAHLRIAATRLIDPDFDFAARFGLHKPWQVWLLRPARLLLARNRHRGH